MISVPWGNFLPTVIFATWDSWQWWRWWLKMTMTYGHDHDQVHCNDFDAFTSPNSISGMMQGAKHWKFTLFFLSILYFIWSIHHCHHHHRHHAGQEQTLGSGWLHFPSAIQVVLWESPSNFIPSSHLDLIWKHVEILLVITGSIFKIYLKSRTIVDLNVMTLCSVDWLPSSQPLGRLKKIVKIWIVKWFCWRGER